MVDDYRKKRENWDGLEAELVSSQACLCVLWELELATLANLSIEFESLQTGQELPV